MSAVVEEEKEEAEIEEMTEGTIVEMTEEMTEEMIEGTIVVEEIVETTEIVGTIEVETEIEKTEETEKIVEVEMIDVMTEIEKVIGEDLLVLDEGMMIIVGESFRKIMWVSNLNSQLKMMVIDVLLPPSLHFPTYTLICSCTFLL